MAESTSPVSGEPINEVGSGVETTEVRRWGREDILAAEDPKTVMEAYHRAIKDSSDRGGLLLSVGERLA